MSAVEVSLLIVIALLVALTVAITVLFLKTVDRTLTHADRVHERAQEHLDKTLDRVMAMDFTTFKSWQLDEPQGNVEFPEEAESQIAQGTVLSPRRWGWNLNGPPEDDEEDVGQREAERLERGVE